MHDLWMGWWVGLWMGGWVGGWIGSYRHVRLRPDLLEGKEGFFHALSVHLLPSQRLAAGFLRGVNQLRPLLRLHSLSAFNVISNSFCSLYAATRLLNTFLTISKLARRTLPMMTWDLTQTEWPPLGWVGG